MSQARSNNESKKPARPSICDPYGLAFSLLGGAIGFVKSFNYNYWLYPAKNMGSLLKITFLSFETITTMMQDAALGFGVWAVNKILTKNHSSLFHDKNNFNFFRNLGIAIGAGKTYFTNYWVYDADDMTDTVKTSYLIFEMLTKIPQWVALGLITWGLAKILLEALQEEIADNKLELDSLTKEHLAEIKQAVDQGNIAAETKATGSQSTASAATSSADPFAATLVPVPPPHRGMGLGLGSNQ